MRVLLFLLATLVVSAQTSYIGGTFINFERNLEVGGWAYELDTMKELGMDTLVVVSAGQFSGNSAGSSPCTANDVTGMNYSGGQIGTGPDKIGMIMNLAEARNMKVWVGSLQTAGSWVSARLADCNKLLVQDMKSLYGSYNAFQGMYMAQEVWLNTYQTPTQDAVVALGNLVQTVKDHASDKRVLAAPYFRKNTVGNYPGVNPTEAANILKMFVETTKVQVVAVQDGVGTAVSGVTAGDTSSYFSAMRNALSNLPVELWSDAETFVTSGSNQDKFPPAPFSRVSAQIINERSYVKKIITWMFGRDMSPQATYHPILASKLYLDYKIGITNGAVSLRKVPFTYTYNTQPNPNYPDPSITKLKDGLGGGFGSDGTEWVNFLDVEDGNSASITLNFSQPVAVKKIRVLMKSTMKDWIKYPDFITESNTGWYFAGWFLPIVGPVLQVPPNPNTHEFSIGWAEVNVPYIGAPPTMNSTTLTFLHYGWLSIAEIEVYE